MKSAMTVAVSAWMCAGSLFANEASFRGENARFLLDKSNGRTSSLIQSGSLSIQVAAEPQVRDGQVEYPVTGRYDVQAMLAGRQQGSLDVEIAERFFSPDFMTEMKEKKQIQMRGFRLSYLDAVPSVDARGARYNDCHKLLVDNIDFGFAPAPITELFQATILSAVEAQVLESLDPAGDIQNGKAILHVCKDVPAGGVTKVDMSGTVRGFSVRLGFDYAR